MSPFVPFCKGGTVHLPRRLRRPVASCLALLPLLAAAPPTAPPHRAAGAWSELRAYGQCLTVEDSREVRLRSCASQYGEPTPAGQQWRLDGQGLLLSALPGALALGLPAGSSPASGALTAAVPATGSGGASTGPWSYDAATGRLGWQDGSRYVLDFNTGADRASLYAPHGGENQQWSFSPSVTATTPPTGTATELRTENRCLTLDPVPTPVRTLTVEPCASLNGAPTPANQRWTVTPDGQVQSTTAPYPVLDVTADRSVVGRPVGNGSDRARWQYDPATGVLRWAADPTLALDHFRSSGTAGLYGANGGANQSWAAVPATDLPGPARVQAAPGAPTAKAASPTSATLSWPAPSGPAPAGYAVRRDGGRIGVTTGRSFRDDGLGPGGLHRYTVTAVSADGAESAPSPEAVLTAPACPSPTGPDGLPPFVPPVPGRPYAVTLTGLPSAEQERQRQGLDQLPSDIRPTGLHLPPGGTLTVSVTGAPATGSLRVLVGPPVGSRLVSARRYPVATSGSTPVRDHRGGMVYLAFDGAATDRVTVTLDGGQAAPVFVLGRTTAAEWRTLLAERPTRYAELVAGRTVVTLTREGAARYAAASPEPVLRHLECARAIEDASAGLTPPGAADASTAPGPDSPGVFPFHYVEVERRAGAAFATNDYTGFQDESVSWIADGASAGWGVWHEQGHHRQQRAVKPGELTEVSVNLHSLAVAKALGRPSRLVAEKAYDTALPKLGRSGVSYGSDFGAFEQLVMLQQLTLEYGEGFWPAVQHAVRVDPPTGTDRWAGLALTTSRVAGQDLTAFYLAWGVPLTAAARQDLAALGLPAAPSGLTGRREP
ncbi:M60 family metallopeptidase [Kitasatospora albolonga]|uniref:M60 family metallopeptidase n=1 Tax=Kitasatospora albolonga TaxID=68173 RepID=UPI0035E55531